MGIYTLSGVSVLSEKCVCDGIKTIYAFLSFECMIQLADPKYLPDVDPKTFLYVALLYLGGHNISLKVYMTERCLKAKVGSL